VLITGGDPMIMRTSVLESYIRPLLEIESLRSIRIGTKSLAWWPYRFVTDGDSEDLLRLFEDVVDAGKHLALMAHYSHPRELAPRISEVAIRRIQETGATIRAQAPLIRQVNDCPDVWAAMWQRQVDLGIIPYYMFVERDTGPRQYFDVPLKRALDIFTRALRQVSGLGRTVRGPSMSCTPGKVLIDGVAEIAGQRVFVLKFLQGRDPNWTNRIFFARYDERASWIDDLEPAFAEGFFFDDPLPEYRRKNFAVYPGALA
jgi:L-lysine 2,3-aminomutase